MIGKTHHISLFILISEQRKAADKHVEFKIIRRVHESKGILICQMENFGIYAAIKM
jgi:hypothetical protein